MEKVSPIKLGKEFVLRKYNININNNKGYIEINNQIKEYNEKKCKSIIDKNIAKIECCNWKENIEIKLTLKYYRNKQKPSWENFL